MKVLFHVDENERWATVIGNITNTLAWAQEKHQDVQIEVLANSEAVLGLTASAAEKNKTAEALSTFLDSGVAIKACENALRGHKIDQKQLLAKVETVPAGIIEIIEKQSSGYAYIRP